MDESESWTTGRYDTGFVHSIFTALEKKPNVPLASGKAVDPQELFVKAWLVADFDVDRFFRVARDGSSYAQIDDG